MTLEVSNPADGGELLVIVTQVSDTIYSELQAVPNTENWNTHQEMKYTMKLPKEKVRIILYGQTAASNKYVGNIYSIKFEKADLTGINSINSVSKKHMGIYTLQGVRVNEPVKGGVYIIDNKKTVIK